MTSPSDYLRVFFSDCKIKLSRAMEFRFDFITGSVLSFIGSFTNILFQFLIYSKTKGYPGWSFDQVLLFQSVVLLFTGIKDTLLGNVRPIFEINVQYGSMDRILLFPFPSLGMILVKGFQFNAIPVILSGLVTLFYAIHKLKLAITWWHLSLFVLFIIIGMILYVSLIIFHCSLALRFIYVEKIRELVDRIINFSFYPAEIFSGLIKIVYLTIIPIAVFAYFPSQALLGRLNLIYICSAGVTLILFFVSIKVWKIQLKNYTGAGG